MLLRKEGIDASREDAKGWTPLFAASYYGRTEVVGLLLRAGVDPGAHKERDDGSADAIKTSLHVACQHGHTAVAKLLILSGSEYTGQSLGSIRGEIVHFATRALADHAAAIEFRICLLSARNSPDHPLHQMSHRGLDTVSRVESFLAPCLEGGSGDCRPNAAVRRSIWHILKAS